METTFQEEDMSCYSVQDTSFDYDLEENWPEIAEACNCTRMMHRYLPICQNVCEPPAPELPPLAEVAIPAVIYLLVFLIGTVGNALVIFVVNRFKRMHNVTNVFLASLSTADLCLIWFCVPIMFVKYMSHTWFLGRFACYSVHYIQQFTCFCSVLTMTMISFERYVAIAHPMRNVWLSSIGRAKKAIVIIWILSALLAIPTALRIDYDKGESLGGERVYCVREFPKFYPLKTELNQAYAIYQMLLLIVFPVVTMSICYTRVALIVYSSSSDKLLTGAVVAFSKAATEAVSYTSYSSIPLSASSAYRQASTSLRAISKKSHRVAEANKKQIVQMLISIVVLYTICWTPTIVDELLISFGWVCRTSNTPSLKYMRLSFNALAYCQSCINPICYAFISQNFRKTFKTAYSRVKMRIQQSDEMRSRCHSYSSLLSNRRVNRARPSSTSFNTLTVPGRGTIITPNMSRDHSQLSLARPRSPTQVSTGTTSTRPRSPTTGSKDSGSSRPRSPTDLSGTSRPRSPGPPRSRSPTDFCRPRSPLAAPSLRPRSPTDTKDYLSVGDGLKYAIVGEEPSTILPQ